MVRWRSIVGELQEVDVRLIELLGDDSPEFKKQEEERLTYYALLDEASDKIDS